VLELAGIHDILSKSLGTQNPINLVKATVAGLRGLRTPDELATLRGLSVNQVLGLGGGPAEGDAAAAGEASAAAGEAETETVAAANGQPTGAEAGSA
jgi:small subunit ribosomal protein S5